MDDLNWVACNIVNQLGDLWRVDVPFRQSTNDEATKFVERLIAGSHADLLSSPSAECESCPWNIRRRAATVMDCEDHIRETGHRDVFRTWPAVTRYITLER